MDVISDPDGILDPREVQNVQQFAIMLKRMHVRAGKRSYRQLEEWASKQRLAGRNQVWLTRSSISEALTGKRLPSKDFVITFLDACAVPRDEWIKWTAAWERVAERQLMSALDPGPPADSVGDPESPLPEQINGETSENIPGQGSDTLAHRSANFQRILHGLRKKLGDEYLETLRSLPPRPIYPFDELHAKRLRGLRIPIGICEDDLEIVSVDFDIEPNLLLFGEAGSGKTSFLRALAESIVRRFKPANARLIVIDYRRHLLNVADTEHRIGYGTSEADTAPLVNSIAGYMDIRLPGPDVTSQQIRERSWWNGPDLFVLVDDYDLVASGNINPLSPLIPFLRRADEIGLHLVIARRSEDAARAIYDPILQRMRQSVGTGLLLSANPEEGTLIGGVKSAHMPTGRGVVLARGQHPQVVQLAYLPPSQ